MTLSRNPSLFIIAVGVVVAGLIYFQAPLSQFALALMLWFGIGGFAGWLERKTKMPHALAFGLGIVGVLGLAAAAALVLAQNVGAIITKADLYEGRLNQLLAQAHTLFGLAGDPASVDDLLKRFNVERFVGDMVRGLQSVLADGLFILIYLAFIAAASSTFTTKIDAMFDDQAGRDHAHAVLGEIRRSMETYLWVQTVISLIISVLTYVTLLALGLDNALFWSFLIFFLNYIPTVGSLIATVLPTLFAVMQFDSLLPVAGVAVGVGFWQFFIGNFIQPRMMGESLNLSAIVVLLSLAIWGLMWGMAGAFLSAPLTVMLLIVCGQFASTRWIAILLSDDGRPKTHRPPPVLQ
jgi:predicted PurR-regulated permease PerM